MKGTYRNVLGILLILAGCFTAGVVHARQDLPEVRSTLQDQKQVAVTIYNDNLALVRDLRRIALPKGESLLALREVSGGMMPETALLQASGDGKTLQVIEQSFDFDLLTPAKLLEKYVGRSVEVVRVHPQTGAESREQAEVLAANGGVVLRMGDRIETGVPGRLVFPAVPENLRDRPTLVVQLASDRAGERELELSYLTTGLSWEADYVAELNPADDRLDLYGWVTLSNQSGAEFRDARLQLVAGNVHRVAGPPVMDFEARSMMAMAEAPKMAEETLLDYHLYTLDRPTTIRQNQVKQVALLTAAGVPAAKEYVLRGGEYYYRGRHGDLGEKLHPAVYLEFNNREKSGLGVPLPKGVIRVYKQDSRGNAQFVGEDRIEHTAKNEAVRLRLGEAFDVNARRVQTDYKKLAGGEKETLIESAYRIELKNAKSEPVTVIVEEPMPGDWQIVQENLPHEKKNARTAVWKIRVPAEGEAQLTYRTRVKY
ncbi:MAG: DUF4139 domain-containing protein [Syntrophotaleaceae bacterium]